MINVQEIIDIFLSAELIEAMGECSYQRLIFCLGFSLPILYLCFGFFALLIFIYSIFKAVGRS